MKWRDIVIVIALLVLALTIGVSFASADSPKDYHYALSACTGFTVVEIQTYQQKFDSDYGFKHQLTTSAQWEGSYISRANEFAVTLGCQPVIGASNQTTFWVRLFAGWFAFYNGATATPN